MPIHVKFDEGLTDLSWEIDIEIVNLWLEQSRMPVALKPDRLALGEWVVKGVEEIVNPFEWRPVMDESTYTKIGKKLRT